MFWYVERERDKFWGFEGGLEGRSPSQKYFPLSFEGEGDTGGEVD